MPASSREPTGLPRTPGNPGRPWRGWKTRGRWMTKRVGGDRWVEDRVERGETKQQRQRKWTEIRHIWGDRGRKWQLHSCKRVADLSMKLRPKRGKRAPSATRMQPVVFHWRTSLKEGPFAGLLFYSLVGLEDQRAPLGPAPTLRERKQKAWGSA